MTLPGFGCFWNTSGDFQPTHYWESDCEGCAHRFQGREGTAFQPTHYWESDCDSQH